MLGACGFMASGCGSHESDARILEWRMGVRAVMDGESGSCFGIAETGSN